MLKLYDNNLIGYFKTGTVEFGDFGFDTEDLYQRNLKVVDSNWLYRSTRVEYSRNSCGHRSKEFDQLDKDFYLFVGCSLTVGSAVPLENTYPYIVSKNNNVDYYNLAVEGAGVDLVSYNLSKWFLNIKKKPKRIIIQWPELARTFRGLGDEIIPLGPWSDNTLKNIKELKQEVENFNSVSCTDYFFHYANIIKDAVRAMCYDTELVEINNFEIIDVGRDLKHPGIESHLKIAKSL